MEYVLGYLAIGVFYVCAVMHFDTEFRYGLKNMNYLYVLLFMAFGVVTWLPSMFLRYARYYLNQ